MKKILLTKLIAISLTAAQAQSKAKVAKPVKDTIDNRMKGPDGEPIVIGKNGGRYYWKNGNKVYVEYKGNKSKKPAAKKSD